MNRMADFRQNKLLAWEWITKRKVLKVSDAYSTFQGFLGVLLSFSEGVPF